MPISFIPKINKRLIGEELSIVNEIHTIPAVAPYTIKLVEVPLQEDPSTVSATVNLVPVAETNFNILAGQYKVDYSTGRITFHSSAAGGTARVSYKGRGSIIAAEDVNELQTPLAAVFNEVETARGTEGTLDARLDTSLNEDGTLKDFIVTPSKISNVITDDFTFPNDVTITGDFTVLGSTSTVVNQIIQNDETVTNTLTVNGNSNLGDASGDTTKIKGSLTIDSSAGTELQFNKKQAKQMVVEVLSADPGSPAEGQIWYRSDLKQWVGYNGTTNVILG